MNIIEWDLIGRCQILLVTLLISQSIKTQFVVNVFKDQNGTLRGKNITFINGFRQATSAKDFIDHIVHELTSKGFPISVGGSQAWGIVLIY